MLDVGLSVAVTLKADASAARKTIRGIITGYSRDKGGTYEVTSADGSVKLFVTRSEMETVEVFGTVRAGIRL